MKKRMINYLLVLVMLFTMTETVLPLEADAAVSKYTWKESVAPNYVKKIGKAKVYKKPKKGTIKYSGLDKLGRTRRAVGNITYKMVEESAGWSENEIVTIPLYNGKQYRGYKWNRSHLIADSLGGRAKRENLITGTRTQNVGANDGKGGMAYTERKAVAWLNKYHNGSVYYSANPVYKGKELIPRSVIVDIKTSDKSINERVVVYNAAKGLKINYTSGATKTIKTTKKVTKKNTTRKSKTKKKESSGGSSKTVYTTQTGSKYHMSKNCRGLGRAKKIYSTALSDAKESGFEPCNICCN